MIFPNNWNNSQNFTKSLLNRRQPPPPTGFLLLESVLTGKIIQSKRLHLWKFTTTGYQWKLSDDFTEGIVKLVKSEYVAPETEMRGAGGQEVWTFKALEPGETTVEMEYVRPWETGVEPVVVKIFGVTVE